MEQDDCFSASVQCLVGISQWTTLSWNKCTGFKGKSLLFPEDWWRNSKISCCIISPLRNSPLRTALWWCNRQSLLGKLQGAYLEAPSSYRKPLWYSGAEQQAIIDVFSFHKLASVCCGRANTVSCMQQTQSCMSGNDGQEDFNASYFPSHCTLHVFWGCGGVLCLIRNWLCTPVWVLYIKSMDLFYSSN